MTHKDLVYIAYKFCLKTMSCGVAFREFKTFNIEIPDVIGFSSGRSVLIECKASRSDFLADKGKIFRKEKALGMGLHRYYCAPVGMIKVEELPEGWGLIEVNEKGKANRKHRPSITNPRYPGSNFKVDYEHPVNLVAEHALMYSALRRLHLRGRIEEIYENQFITEDK